MKVFSMFLLVAMTIPTFAGSNEERPRWLVVLSDQSQVFVTPASSVLRLESEVLGGCLSIPVKFVQTVERGQNGKWQWNLSNGDRVSGDLAGGSIRAKSLLGEIELPPKYIRRIEVVERDSTADVEKKITGLSQLIYEGFPWDLWRTGWEVVEGNKLASTRSVRPGFAYGHWANGRGGMAVTGNGDQSWTDYEVSFDYKMLPANREFYHAYIPGESRGMTLFFRAKSLSESWNQPDTGYGLAINPSGTWSLVAYDGWHMPGNGYSSSNQKGAYEKLASGKAENAADAGEGRIRLLVEGNTFQAWLNDERLFEFTHDSGELEPISYGGFGVQWRYESMGWIQNLKVQRASRKARERQR